MSREGIIHHRERLYPHPNGVPELMRREVVEVLMAISDLALQCPFVELPTKSGLEVGFGR